MLENDREVHLWDLSQYPDYITPIRSIFNDFESNVITNLAISSDRTTVAIASERNFQEEKVFLLTLLNHNHFSQGNFMKKGEVELTEPIQFLESSLDGKT